MPAGLSRGHGNWLVTARRQNHHGIERLFEQVPPVGEAAADRIGVAQPVDNRARQIAERRDFEAVIELSQIVQVHHLRDQSAADDADAKSRLSQAGRDYTPVIDDRSIHRACTRPQDLTTSIAVAGAPVSFGAFEVTVGTDPHVPDALSVLDAFQQAGYAGIDLGPPGYLGNKAELRTRLENRRLQLEGGYLAMPFSEPARMPAPTDELRGLLDVFDGVRDSG